MHVTLLRSQFLAIEAAANRGQSQHLNARGTP